MLMLVNIHIPHHEVLFFIFGAQDEYKGVVCMMVYPTNTLPLLFATHIQCSLCISMVVHK